MRPYKQHMMSWVTGRALGLQLPAEGAATLVAEDSRALEWASAEGLVGPGTLTFCPSAEVAGAVPYQGSLVEAGAEVRIGDDFFLQVQAYSIAGFLALLGPTVIRCTDEEDVETFLADADTALAEGSWSDVLTNPAVQLADVASLGGAAPLDGPRLRLYLVEDEVRVGPVGPVLGKVGDQLSPAHHSGPGTSHLSVPADLQRQVADRTWLSRYHAAVQALQSLRARGYEDNAVSGFGVRFNSHLSVDAEARDLTLPDAPVLLRSGETHFVYEPASSRTFQASEETVEALERVLVEPSASEDTPTWTQARDFVDRTLAAAEAAA